MPPIYRNVRIPPQSEATFVKEENREFVRLLGIVVALFAALALVLEALVWWFVPKVSFATEREFARLMGLDTPILKVFGSPPNSDEAKAIERALQARVEALHTLLEFPAELKITAHYRESETVNAVATLGGHVTVLKGLLQKIDSNDELDAVLAHEMGHVRHRHGLKHMKRGIGMMIALNLVGIRSNLVNQLLIGDGARLVLLSHSRNAEREADEAAKTALLRRYGHTRGLVVLFERFKALEAKKGVDTLPNLVRSHPWPEARQKSAQDAANASGPLTPLDEVFARLKEKKSSEATATK